MIKYSTFLGFTIVYLLWFKTCKFRDAWMGTHDLLTIIENRLNTVLTLQLFPMAYALIKKIYLLNSV